MANPKLTKSRLEALLALATGTVAQPASGLAGLYALARGKDGAKAVADTQQALTYAPRDGRGLQEIAQAINPVTSRLEGLKHYLGDKAQDHGASPLGATAAYMVPDTLLTLLGARGMGVKGPKLAELVQGTRELPSMGSARSQIGAIGAWHGSPHDFDRFSLDHIGSGEGAQAYGHGLYFAGNKEDAGQYQRTLAADGFRRQDGSVFDPSKLEHMNVRHAARSGDLDATIARAEGLLPGATEQTRPMLERDLSTLRQLQAEGGISPNSGRLYNVELAPDEADLLDWDAPLSEQPEKVRAALEAMDPDTYHPSGSDYDPHETGQMIYHRLQNDARDYAITAGKNHDTTLGAIGAKASRDLHAFGIPGIRYLDGGSRAAGDGSRNYVMFDDSLVHIKGKE